MGAICPIIQIIIKSINIIILQTGPRLQTLAGGIDTVVRFNSSLYPNLWSRNTKKSVLQTALCLAVTTVFAVTAQAATELNHWPDATKRQLDETLPHNASEGNFAASDTASTSYRAGLENR